MHVRTMNNEHEHWTLNNQRIFACSRNLFFEDLNKFEGFKTQLRCLTTLQYGLEMSVK